MFSVYIPMERDVTISDTDVSAFILSNYKLLGKSRKSIDSEIVNRRNWILKGCKMEESNEITDGLSLQSGEIL